MPYFVYILKTSSNTLYIGQTNNLERRISEHKDKKSRASKYIRSFKSFELVYHESFETRSEALKREAALKKLTHKSKQLLITNSEN